MEEFRRLKKELKELDTLKTAIEGRLSLYPVCAWHHRNVEATYSVEILGQQKMVCKACVKSVARLNNKYY